LGDTLVQKKKVYTYEALLLENTITGRLAILTYTVLPGPLIQSKRDKKYTYYTSDNTEAKDLGGTITLVGGLMINNEDPSDIRLMAGGHSTRPTPEPIFSKTKVVATDRPGFGQEFIYNGRIGDTLKFLYREFSNDMLRGSFSQEVQYDLNESKTIGFKGVRLEILEATNTKIKYVVHASFPDSL
jgi:hypothetical protein